MNLNVDLGLRSTNIPLFVCFAAFLVTFVATRVITRMIRAGKGPFHDNVSEGGLHVHHAVPGIILLVVGAFTAVATHSDTWTIVAAILVGAGTSLVLDEFALILHLEDVYWSDEGRISVEMVSLAIACLGLVLIGVRPFDFSGAGVDTLSVFTIVAITVTSILGCVTKGKYKLALFGCFIPFAAIVGTIRLARPKSRWARKHYDAVKTDRAAERARRTDRRWGRYSRWMNDFAGMGEATRSSADPGSAPDGA